jgi:anti-sigma B factor antagonist
MSTSAADDESLYRGDSPISGIDVATSHDPSGAIIVAISGEIDLKNGTQLRELLLRLVADQPPMLVISLELVTFLDSTGLATLVATNRQARELDVEVRVTAPAAGPRRVLDISGLDNAFAIYPNLAAALQADQ